MSYSCALVVHLLSHFIRIWHFISWRKTRICPDFFGIRSHNQFCPKYRMMRHLQSNWDCCCYCVRLRVFYHIHVWRNACWLRKQKISSTAGISITYNVKVLIVGTLHDRGCFCNYAFRFVILFTRFSCCKWIIPNISVVALNRIQFLKRKRQMKINDSHARI